MKHSENGTPPDAERRRRRFFCDKRDKLDKLDKLDKRDKRKAAGVPGNKRRGEEGMERIADTLRAVQKGCCAVVVVAAGRSERMGQDKLLMELDGIPVLARTLLALEHCGAVDELVLVTRETLFAAVGEWRERYALQKLTHMVPGGATRTESALAGVLAVSSRAKIIGIHDGARPFVTPELAEAAIRGAVLHRASAPAIPVKDTLKRARGGMVAETPDRSEFFAVQTPQCFRAELIKAALTRAVAERTVYTDDCAAVEAIGSSVVLTPGDEDNIKLTTPADLALARLILRRHTTGEGNGQEQETGAESTETGTQEPETWTENAGTSTRDTATGTQKEATQMRIGQGYDVHRFAPERKLILCGVEIPHSRGLLGHSDADVAAHALMDALLGAAALGDIGKLFPDSDPAYAGADSLLLLREVCRRVRAAGYRISNVDCTIVAQAPKLAPYIPQMRENLAGAAGLALDRVSVKATTEERLGFTGREEGIAAQAVCLLEE